MTPFVLLAAFAAAASAQITPLVFHSSASFDSGGNQTDQALAVAVSSTSDVFVAGVANNDFQLVKYDKRLRQSAVRTFDAGGVETARGVALGPSGEVVLVGDDSTRMLIVRYNAALAFTSSATFTAPGGTGDRAQAVAIDSAGNIVVAGFATVAGVASVSVVRFDSQLRVLGSAVLAGGRGFGVALDAAANAYVTGFSTGTAPDFLTVKYSPTLGSVLARHNLDSGLGRTEQGQAVAVDSAGRVAVAGHVVNGLAGTADIAALRYDSSLVFVASAVFSLGGFMQGKGVSFSPDGNAVVLGSTAQGDPSALIGLRYASSLALVSSSTLQNQTSDHGGAVAIDSKGNIFAAGDTNTGAQVDFTTVRFMGAPEVASVGIATQGVNTLISVQGDNFVGQVGGLLFSSVTLQTSGLRVLGAAMDTVEQLRFNVSVASFVPVGSYPFTITNPDTSSTTVALGLKVVASFSINPAGGQVLDFTGTGGPIRFVIPAGAFAGPFDMVISSPTAFPQTGALIDTGLRFEIEERPAVADPTQDITIRMTYRPQDVEGIDVETLAISYYDAVAQTWMPELSDKDAAARTASANTRHFTLWALLSQPKSGDGAGVLIVPNPYKPGSGGPFDDGPGGKGILFRNLPNEFSMKVYSVLGRPVFEKNGVAVGGKFRWDARDIIGNPVPSGVYIAVISRPNGSLVSKGKFAIIR
ncbi:MAG: hypothetical protein HY553_15325 [Elusimicrobia bacterium]|nr:hypothetical protein [Elusimicrobiota bacterium]